MAGIAFIYFLSFLTAAPAQGFSVRSPGFVHAHFVPNPRSERVYLQMPDRKVTHQPQMERHPIFSHVKHLGFVGKDDSLQASPVEASSSAGSQAL